MIDLKKLREKAFAGDFSSGDALELLDMLEAAQKDASRWKMVSKHWKKADFKYGKSGEMTGVDLAIRLSHNGSMGHILEKEFDAAMRS